MRWGGNRDKKEKKVGEKEERENRVGEKGEGEERGRWGR